MKQGYNFNIETISNSKESLNLSKELIETVKYEILLIIASSSAFFRLEKNIGYRNLEELAYQNIKVKILIPSKTDLQDKINQVTSKYPKIEFRILQISNGPIVGVTIIDRQRVLIYEVKDDTKSSYLDSVGMTINIEGKSTAMSYATIFNSLWKQTETIMIKFRFTIKCKETLSILQPMNFGHPSNQYLVSQNILKTKSNDKEQLGFLDIIYRNTKRLKKLSEDILEISKIENNLLGLNKENFKIKELISQIVSDYKKEAEAKNIEFEFTNLRNDDDLFIYADRQKVFQVVSNLISNSIKFIANEKGGKDIYISRKKSQR